MAAGGLFLLQGDTGAGQDQHPRRPGVRALRLGARGSVPGANRLRSDHADPAVRTSVELEVTIGGRRFRITALARSRSGPSSGARARRGSQARSCCEEAVDGGWRTAVRTGGRGGRRAAPTCSGMSADQFHQVVLLPQGEFARFLRSEAAERAQLLQRLFATDRFRRVEDWLAERRRACSAALAEAEAAVLRTAARVAQAAGLAEPELGEEGIPLPGWGVSVGEEAARAAQAAEVEAEESRKAQAEAEGLLQEARELSRRQTRRRELLSRQARLDQQRPRPGGGREPARTGASGGRAARRPGAAWAAPCRRRRAGRPGAPRASSAGALGSGRRGPGRTACGGRTEPAHARAARRGDAGSSRSSARWTGAARRPSGRLPRPDGARRRSERARCGAAAAGEAASTAGGARRPAAADPRSRGRRGAAFVAPRGTRPASRSAAGIARGRPRSC